MPSFLQNLVYYSWLSLEGDDYSPSLWLQCNRKNQHLNILSYSSTVIVKGTTRGNMLKDKLNEMFKICFTDISVTFLRPLQSTKFYKDFIF